MTEISDPERVDTCVILREARIGYSMSDPAPHAYEKLIILRTSLSPQIHVRRVEASGANIPILRRYHRRYHYFLAPADHEDYKSHGWYQCQCRKNTSRIEQDKDRHEED